MSVRFILDPRATTLRADVAALALLLASSLGAAACRQSAPAPKETHLEVSARVRPNPRNAIGALVEVKTSGAARVWVEHGDTEAYGERTPTVTMPPSGSVDIPVIGLTPGARSHFLVHVENPHGISSHEVALVLDVGPLPPEVPASFPVAKSSAGASGYVLVGLHNPTKESYVATMIDRKGRVRWYWVAPPPISPGAHFDRVRGHFLVVDGSTDLFLELDLAGEVVRKWQDTAAPQGLDSHDFLLRPNGNALMIGWEFRAVDSRSLFPGGTKNAIRADHTIDEIDPWGKALFHWSSYDHVTPDEVILGPHFDATNFQIVHTNSLEVLPDGNILASFRATSSVMKIDRANGAVLWRLGGKKSDFAFVGDPEHGFSRQHDARLLENGEVMIFDNGNEREPKRSRVVRYKLDESSKTATLTWQYLHQPDVFSDAHGSARRLPNRNTLVGYKTGLITEVDESRTVVWEANTEPWLVYRALYVPSLYP